MAKSPGIDADASFDFVIVGGGTAGCLLANRLSANPDVSVLLIEAGGSDRRFWINVPVGYLYNMGNPAVDWCYRTESDGPQWPLAGLSARQGARRLFLDQWHDLHAGAGGGLRRLAADGQPRLGLG